MGQAKSPSVEFFPRISAETDEARLGSTIVDLSEAGVYSVNRAGCALGRTREVMEKHGIKEVP